MSRSQSLKRNKPCMKHKQVPPALAERTRKIRFICDDPYATESDTDDESKSCPKPVKKFICEINLPIVDKREVKQSRPVETESSCQDSTKIPVKRRRVLPKAKATSDSEMPRNADHPKKHKGIRFRKWGKWAAEIRDPFKKERKWLGTYDTFEQALDAYKAKKREFETEMARCSQPISRSQSLNNMSSSGDTDSVLSHNSLSSVLGDTGDEKFSVATNEKSIVLPKNDNLAVELMNAEGMDTNFDIEFFNDLPMPTEWLGPELGNDVTLDLELCNEFDMLGGDFCDLDELNLGGGFEIDEPVRLPDCVFSLENGNDEISSFVNELTPLNVACL